MAYSRGHVAEEPVMRALVLTLALGATACAAEHDPRGAGQIADGSAPSSQSAADIFTTQPAPSGSLRYRAWTALQRADRVDVLSLDPNAYFMPPDIDLPYGSKEHRAESERLHREWLEDRARRCREIRCVDHHFVVGSTGIDGRSLNEVRGALREALTRLPDYATACAPIYRHAVVFRDRETKWELKLCFECGQVAIGRDGDWSGDEQAAGMTADALFDALLKRAGQRLAPAFGPSQPSA
jgi:hypothetical protein